MNELPNELDKLFVKIKDNKKILKYNENVTLSELKKICDASPQMVSILLFENNSYSLAYPNRVTHEFLGADETEYLDLGFQFVLKSTHPDNIDSVYMLIKFFNDPSNRSNTFTHTLCLNTKNGWEWIYYMVKPVTLNKDGTVRYLIALGVSLDDLLENEKHVHQSINSSSLYEENMDLYNSLTEREKEVLKLIAMELTSKEIGELLFISPLTVDTHRKHLIEKLKVKSSIGLIKYALLFNLV